MLYLIISVVSLESLIGSGLLLNGDTATDDSVVIFDQNLLIGFIILLLFSLLAFYIIFIKLKNLGTRLVYTLLFFVTFIYTTLEFVYVLRNEENQMMKEFLLTTSLILLILYSVYFIQIFGRGLFSQRDILIRNGGLVLIGAISGRMMAYYINLQAIIIFGLILSIFDAWNVFYGPLSSVIGKPRSTVNSTLIPDHIWLNQISIVTKKGTPVYISLSQKSMLGIGDLVVFSILLYRSLIEWSYLGLLFASILIIGGNLITYRLLRRLNPLPGLPIPVLLTISGFFILQQVI